MYRHIINNGDLITTKHPWWMFGKEIPHRNRSEEVRNLYDQLKKAESKYHELYNLHVIASTNVAEELETLQALLLDNSSAYIESDVDTSILQKRDGIKYNYGRNNKKDSSSNKDKQQNQQQQQQKDQSGNRKQDKSISLADILLKGRVTLH